MAKADFNITSIIITDGDEDRIDLFTVGEYTETEDGFEMSYSEGDGIGYENCSVRIIAQGDLVTVERTGDAATTLTVEKNVKHHCVYGTPFGDFTMGINTYEVDNTLGKDGGRLWFKYSIDINNDFVSENEMEIVVTTEESKDYYTISVTEEEKGFDDGIDGPF